MNILTNCLFFILSTFFCIKTIFYGIYELKQKNTFGGSFVIVLSFISYILFIVIMSGTII